VTVPSSVTELDLCSLMICDVVSEYSSNVTFSSLLTLGFFLFGLTLALLNSSLKQFLIKSFSNSIWLNFCSVALLNSIFTSEKLNL